MKILIINGPNINMLGFREPDIYGSDGYSALLRLIEEKCHELSIEFKCFQSNGEGAIIDEIQAAYGHFDAIIINPAAYTHTSIAIADALRCVMIPCVEVHISDLSQRENYRQVSYVRKVCEKTISGRGLDGYKQAIEYLNKKYGEKI